MHTLKTVVFAAFTAGSLALFGSPPAHAAVLSVSDPTTSYGGYVCADVSAGSLGTPPGNPVKVQAWDCHAGPNQQYELNGTTIYALGGQRCLTVNWPTQQVPPGTTVVSIPCNGSVGVQPWVYFPNGEIILEVTTPDYGNHNP
jgi:hypothetical protein